jgi:hypothetical protein
VRDVLALIQMRSQDLRGHNRNPRPASPGSTTEVETSHPLLSCTSMVPEREQRAKPKYAHNAPGPSGCHGRTGRSGVMRNPRGHWRWPKSRPRGPTGRVGAGLKGPDLPRDEARFSSRRLGRNPPSGTPVTRKDAAPLPDGCSPSPKCRQRCGQDTGAAGRARSRSGQDPAPPLSEPRGRGAVWTGERATREDGASRPPPQASRKSQPGAQVAEELAGQRGGR